MERALRVRLDAVGPTSRAVLRHTLFPGGERALRVGDLFGDPRTRTFAEPLINLEESPNARAAVLGELRERELCGES